jgi:hypothetical protein
VVGFLRRSAIVVVLAVALAACSGGSDEPVDEGTRVGPLDGMHYDLGWETTLVGIGGGEFALVRGLTPGSRGRRLTVTIGSQAGSSRRYETPSRAAFVSVDAWWTGEEVVVVGPRCAELDTTMVEAEMSDDLYADQMCRRPLTGEAHALDPATGRWRVIGRDLPLGLSGYLSVEAAHGPIGLLARYGERENSTRYQRLDVRTGKRTPIEPPNREEGIFCLGPHGLLYVSSHEDLDRVFDGTQTDTTTRAFALVEARWVEEPLRTPGPLPRLLPVSGCDPQGGFVSNVLGRGDVPRWRHSAPDELTWAPIPEPPRDDARLYNAPEALGLGVAYRKAGSMDLRVYRLVDGRWIERGRLVRPYPPDTTVVSGRDVAYLAPTFSPGRVVLVDP